MLSQSIPTYEDYKRDKNNKSDGPDGELSPDELMQMLTM
jgi:hypothetical protein